jgi:DNA polymerase-3 subunit epsilon
MRWAAIDFETANEKHGSACAIGVAFVDDGKITGTNSWLIRPQDPVFNPFNVGIHGISAADIADAPEFDSVWRELWPQLAGRTLLAHYAPFDMSVLRSSLDAYRMHHPRFKYFCTVVLSRQAWPGLRNHKLPTVAEHVGFTFKHHDAEEDAVASARIGLAAVQELGVGATAGAEVWENRYLLQEFGAAR